MNNNETDKGRYLALAADAFAAAERMRDRAAQATLRSIARGYLAIAKMADRRESTITTAPRQYPGPRTA